MNTKLHQMEVMRKLSQEEQDLKSKGEFGEHAMVAMQQRIVGLMMEGVEGAAPNYTRVQKINSTPNDVQQDGCIGTIVGALWAGHITNTLPKDDERRKAKFLYLIDWDQQFKQDMPSNAVVLISDFKLHYIAHEPSYTKRTDKPHIYLSYHTEKTDLTL